MNIRKLVLASLVLPLLSGCNSLVDENPTKKPSSEDSSSSEPIDFSKEYKVLFIGNSFTFYNDLEVVTKKLAESMEFVNFTTERVAASSYKLSQHADANDPVGKQVEEKLKNNSYTHIIMQEQSTLPLSNYDSFLGGARALLTKIKTYQPTAKVSLYQTWGYNNMVGNYGSSIPECETALFNAYKKCAKELNIGVHYVGRAFTKSYQEQSAINLYYSGDNKHPSFKGTYLAGLIHLGSLTGADVRETTYRGVEGSTNQYGETYINNEEATALKDIANNVLNQYGTNY